jgi:hypothetical protein
MEFARACPGMTWKRGAGLAWGAGGEQLLGEVAVGHDLQVLVGVDRDLTQLGGGSKRMEGEGHDLKVHVPGYWGNGGHDLEHARGWGWGGGRGS